MHASRSGGVLNYPGHWAGFGLLLLRGTAGITVALQAWLAVSPANGDLLVTVSAAALVLAGVALTLGLFSPVSSAIVALGYALSLVVPFGTALLPQLDRTAAIVCLAAAAGLGFVGPGAFSIDARLFGRREIFIPAEDRSGRS